MRSVSMSSLRDFFEVSDDKIKEYIDKQSFFDESNEFIWPTWELRDLYFTSYDYKEFFKQLNDFHVSEFGTLFEEVNSEKDKGEFEVTTCLVEILQKLSNGKPVSRDHLVRLGVTSLERVKRELLQENKIELFDTKRYLGNLMLYARIAEDLRELQPQRSLFRRTQQSANVDLYQLAREQLRYSFKYSSPVIPSIAFNIRQAIEVKVYELLGVEEFKDANGKRTIISISKLLKFCKKCCQNDQLFFPVNIDVVIAANAWSNGYIHTGNACFPNFILECLLNELEPLFTMGSDSFEISLCKSVKKSAQYSTSRMQKDLDIFLSTKKRKIKGRYGKPMLLKMS